jgi:hypothetical protein
LATCAKLVVGYFFSKNGNLALYSQISIFL